MTNMAVMLKLLKVVFFRTKRVMALNLLCKNQNIFFLAMNYRDK